MATESNPGSSANSGAEDSLRFHLRKLQRHPKYQAAQLALRSARRIVPNAWRQATSRLRPLPGTVIVGVAKSGTSQLFSYILRHPRCFGSVEKEVNYFSYHSQRSLGWYRSRFPRARTVEAVDGICMEASPSYLTTPHALPRMYRVLPKAKLLVILRDPVARAFSQYQHHKQRRQESRPFDEIVRESIANSPPVARRDRPLPPLPESVAYYIWQGYYASLLAKLFGVYPRKQVLVLDAGHMFDDTNAVCQQVFDFLGLESFDVKPDRIYNRGFYRETIDPATAELLREHYRPHDEWLAELTGQKFGWTEAAAGASDARRVA